MINTVEVKKITEISRKNKIAQVQKWIQSINLENKIVQRAKDGFSNITIMANKCPNIEAFLLELDNAGYKAQTLDNDPYLANCVEISWQ